MANRFQEKFLRELVKLSQEYGFVITEGGVLEPINDWVDDGKQFKYTFKINDEENAIITGVEMV